MKHLNQIILIILTALFLFSIVNGITEGFGSLFIFPLLALTTYLGYYLVTQMREEHKQRLTTGMKHAVEEKNAEEWLQKEFVPHTLSFITTRHWVIITYTFLFLLGVGFLWSYLIHGFWPAVQETSYTLLLFWLFVFYIIFFPKMLAPLTRIIPKKIFRILSNDWMHGYLLLLPITYVLYLLVPFETIQQTLFTKLMSFPTFFLIYTSFFLCLFALVSLNHLIHQEDEKKLKEEIMKELEKKE